jgi:hypothetical protein
MHHREPDEEHLFIPGRVRYGNPGDGELYPGADEDE